MKARFLFPCVIILFGGCASQRSGADNRSSGDTRSKAVDYLDAETYLISEISVDPSYGYKQSNPIKVGRDDGSGPLNERRFLNALLGPNGEAIEYYRAGSCCPFKTPNGIIDNTGMLDRYRISWQGAKDTLDIYMNMYDKGNLLVPVGLTAKKKI